MPTPLQSKQHFAGSRFPAQSRQRERHFTDSTTAERRAWAATRWVHGRARQTCPQPAAVVSDQFCFTSEFGCFCPLQCSLRNGGGAEMADLTVIAASCTGRSLAVLLLCLRRQAEPRAVMLISWPDEVARPYCRSWPICGASRPLESLGAPLSLTVSAVCGRRNEWNGNVACEIAVKWSGAGAN